MAIWGFIIGLVLQTGISIYIGFRAHRDKKPIFYHILVANLLAMINCCVSFNAYVTGTARHVWIAYIAMTYYTAVVIERWYVFTRAIHQAWRIFFHMLNIVPAVILIIGPYVMPRTTSFLTYIMIFFFVRGSLLNYGINCYIIYNTQKMSMRFNEKKSYFFMLYGVTFLSFANVAVSVATTGLAARPALADIITNVTALLLPNRFICEAIFQFAVQRIFERRTNKTSGIKTEKDKGNKITVKETRGIAQSESVGQSAVSGPSGF
jgi:hypothetical protein